jgi:serine/threonine protein kinase
MIETGKVLQNRYRIDKQIGQGGMGAVYVATDERFGSTVAIKETLCMDNNYRKAIEREARLLNSLKHTALPRVTDHFLEENGQFLVMEYIPGEDLFDMIEGRKTPFPVEDILRWADQLLDALEFLHTQHIPVIHRDIKPQNLKIASRGQIILLDFGLAKGNPTDAEHNTAAKSIFGYSRNYASLEQIQGTGTDPRSDLYSLAATLYHLVTAVPPEDALTRAMCVLSQKADPLIPANRINPEVPRGVAEVLHNAMDLNAAERPGSAAKMRQILRDCDKSIIPGEAETIITPYETDLLAQETRLMGGETLQEGGKQTDVKTQILPTNDSQETAVRRGLAGSADNTRQTNFVPATAQPGVTAGRKGIAAIAALLLLFVGCAAGLYMYKPSIFGSAAPAEGSPMKADVSNVIVNSNGTGANAVIAANTAPVNSEKPGPSGEEFRRPARDRDER